MKNLKNTILKNQFYLAVIVAATLVITGLFFGWYNNRVVPLDTNPIARYASEPGNHLSFMANWDSLNYIGIATHGYDGVSQTNFFPLYPLLIHILHWVISSPLDCALIISWLSLVGLIYFYLKIIGVVFYDKGAKALRAALLLLLFPSAIFFLAAYTESLFAFFALGSIYFALKKRYVYAAALAIPMNATHITGIFVLILLGLILWEQKAKLTQIISTVAVGSLGLLGYMFYLLEKYHKPFSFITSQKGHGWLSTHYSNLVASAGGFSVIFIILIIASAIYWWKQKRPSFSIYALLFLLIPAVGQQFGGFNRYVLMAFPVPLMLYGVTRKRPNLFVFTIVLTSIAWTYFLLQYAGGYIGS